MTLSVQMTHALDGFTLDVDFEAPAGVTVLFGQSGSGKTSVIRGVAGLLIPNKGRVSLDGEVLFDTNTGQAVPTHQRRLGYIFQDARLFPHLSVSQNLEYGAKLAGDRQEVITFERVVDMLGIGHLLARRPTGLSGGEKQRVAIGRALLARPRLILADEPLAALDEPRKADILPYFERLRDEVDIPVLYVTHSVAELARLATTVVILQEGRVVQQGPVDHVMSEPVGGGMGVGIRAAGSLLQAHVVRQHEDGLTELAAGDTPLFLPRVDRAPGSIVRLRVAAHDVILALEKPKGLSALNILAGRIKTIRQGDGPGALVSLETAAGMVLARITARSAITLGLAQGQSCYAVIKSVAIAPEDVGGPQKPKN